MQDRTAFDSLADAVRSSRLLDPGSRGLALCSGGADSAALLAGLAGAYGAGAVTALHLNYGLRPDSRRDEAACAALCERLGVELVIERPGPAPAGNTQAWAREARYEAAERLRAARGLDWIAVGHTRGDLAETVLFRLASSPGSRALLGLPARRGRLIRPLLGLRRAQARDLAEAAGLPFRDDPSNADDGYARNRIRNRVIPELERIAPAAERTIAETQAELREEHVALERIASGVIEAAGAGPGAPSIPAEALRELDPAIRRLVLRGLAERAAGRPVALGRGRAAGIWALAQRPEGGVAELGGGVEARVEHGHILFAAGPIAVAAETALPVPGSCRFGDWEVRAELGAVPADPRDRDLAYLDPAALEATLLVRPWRRGDRIRPLGLDGSKSLQDLFTDRRVPRSLRRTLPVITSGERVAWIAGVAVSREFAAEPGAARAAVLSAAIAAGEAGPAGAPPLNT